MSTPETSLESSGDVDSGVAGRVAKQFPSGSFLQKALCAVDEGRVLSALKNRSSVLIEEVRNAYRYARYHRKSPLTVTVLGMHRSGTSCITRIISLCNASVGNKLVSANSTNKRGHWEHQYAVRINRELLARSGGAWDDPPSSLASPPLVLRLKMRRLLGEIHRGQSVGLWKDPRTTLTFPAWKSVVPNLLPVFIFRHPMSVAHSLRKRNGFRIEKGLDLWCTYNRRILDVASQEEQTHFFNFDGGRDHLRRQTQRLAAQTPLSYTEEALDFYDDSLRDSDVSAAIPDRPAQRIYEKLKQRCST